MKSRPTFPSDFQTYREPFVGSAAVLTTLAPKLIYCDPPYSHSQAILYGAQSFSLSNLFRVIERCKRKGVYVALSIDGTKRSGQYVCDLPVPDGLFEREIFIDCGRSMLKRFRMDGQTLEGEVVSDHVILFPQDHQSPFLIERRQNTDPTGNFTITGIAPGVYAIFVAPPNGALELEDPEVRRRLQSYGKSVDLGPRKNATAELVLIPESGEPQ